MTVPPPSSATFCMAALMARESILAPSPFAPKSLTFTAPKQFSIPEMSNAIPAAILRELFLAVGIIGLLF